jgi:hypothetical protein
MTDDRYKQIMADLGQSNSQSLLAALQQVANETAQAVRKQVATECAKLCEDLPPSENADYCDAGMHAIATLDCEAAIKAWFGLDVVQEVVGVKE